MTKFRRGDRITRNDGAVEARVIRVFRGGQPDSDDYIVEFLEDDTTANYREFPVKELDSFWSLSKEQDTVAQTVAARSR